MAIFDELKSVANVLREADKIPQYEQILGVQEKLLEMQNRIFELEKENRELKEKINKKESLVHRDGTYYQIIEDETEDGPFCTLCYDDGEKLIRMEIDRFAFGVNSNPIYYSKHCPKCNRYLK